jgi:TIR domain
MPHHVFLSYSRKDTRIMQRVRDDLRAAGLSVWTDEGIEPGTNSWKQSIQDSIDNASCLVVILSPDAKKSEWVGRELDYANAQRLSIFPLLSRGNEANAVPLSLISSQFVDIRKNYLTGIEKLHSVLHEHLQLEPPRPPAHTNGISHVPAAILSDDDNLDPWNSFDQARLFGWLFLAPGTVLAERDRSGDEIIRQTVAWIIGAVAWLPFLMIVAGSALGTMDAPGNGLYLVIAGLMYLLGWYATARFGWQQERKRGLFLLGLATIITLASYWLIGVRAGLQIMTTGRTTVTAFVIFTTCISIGGASGLAFRLANSTTGTLAGTVIGTVIYTALSGLELGIAAGLAGIAMVAVAFGVRIALDRNLRSGQPSRLGYIMLTILAIDYILMIAVYFVGGWRILTGQ